MTRIFKPRPLALAIAVAVGTAPGYALAAAGRVQFAFGEVSLRDAGGDSSPLKKGQVVDAGDTIVTERGRVQVKFSDGSFVSLQPKSTFKIDEYAYADDADGGERSFFSLFRGGLRTITGVIGRRNRDSYRVSTPVATIGIRGTEYLIMLDGTGAIVTVGDGAIAVINDAGQVVLVNGQTGVIVDKSTLATITDEKAVVPPEPPKDLRDEPGTNTPQQDDENLVGGTIGDDGIAEDTADGLLVDTNDEVEPPPPPIIPPKLESGDGFTVAHAFYSSDHGPVSTYDSDASATFVEGQLTGWTFESGEGIQTSSIGDLTLVEAGSDEFIGWGRWSNSDNNDRHFTVASEDEEFTNQDESLHFVAGEPSDLVSAAGGRSEARYSTLSYTTPTDGEGNEGTFNSATFLVDFGDQDVSGTVDLTMSGDDYDIAFFDAPVYGGGFSTSASVESSGGCGCGGCSSYVSGLVAGPTAERAGFVYHISDNNEERDIFGATTFIADPNGPLPPIEP